MKRIDLIRHLERHACALLREGNNHTVYVNRRSRKSSSVPRHREIHDFLARKICDDLDVPRIRYTARSALRERFPNDVRSLDRLLGQRAIRIEHQRHSFLEVFARFFKSCPLRVGAGQFLDKRNIPCRSLHEDGREFYWRHTLILTAGLTLNHAPLPRQYRSRSARANDRTLARTISLAMNYLAFCFKQPSAQAP